MKFTNLISALIFFVMGLMIIGCSEDTENLLAGSTSGQIAIVWVDYCTWAVNGGVVGTAEGQLQAQPLPHFDYFRLKFGSDSATYEEKEPWDDQFGLFRFSAGIGIYAADYSEMSAEIKTSIGTISGQIGLPGSVDTIFADVGDSLNPGEPLKITWTDSDADFYIVHYMYIYRNSQGDLKALTVDKFVESNSLSFDSTSFIYNGEINIQSVKPINGPFPDSHSAGNMNGGGTGYLYYTNSLGQSGSKSIKVGSGWSAGAEAPPKINRDIKSERINVRDLLIKRLNLSIK